MGHGRMDVFLYSCTSRLFFVLALVLFLENGQFLVGSDSCCFGRIWEENDCSCKFKPQALTFFLRSIDIPFY